MPSGIRHIKQKEAELRASLKLEQRKAERAAEEKLRKAYDTKLEAAALKARHEERQKSDRFRLQMETKCEELQRKLDRQKSDDLGERARRDEGLSLRRVLAVLQGLVLRLRTHHGDAPI